MRFRYPLQKIVDLKSSEKSMAEWEYAASLGRLREEEECLRDLRARRADAEERLAGAASRGAALAELSAMQDYLDALDRQINRQSDQVAAAEALVRERQGRLAEKSVEEKVWLNTREKAYAAFKAAWQTKQQNELDEIAIVRAASTRG